MNEGDRNLSRRKQRHFGQCKVAHEYTVNSLINIGCGEQLQHMPLTQWGDVNNNIHNHL
jgi:hypothetical protein